MYYSINFPSWNHSKYTTSIVWPFLVGGHSKCNVVSPFLRESHSNSSVESPFLAEGHSTVNVI